MQKRNNSKIARIRRKKFIEQQGHCYYCAQPMSEGTPDEFAHKYRMTPRRSKQFQSTAEHLRPRHEGGPDCTQNIVAACRFCNSRRHSAANPLVPNEYQKKVRKRLQSDKWHQFIAASLTMDAHGPSPAARA